MKKGQPYKKHRFNRDGLSRTHWTKKLSLTGELVSFDFRTGFYLRNILRDLLEDLSRWNWAWIGIIVFTVSFWTVIIKWIF